MDDVFNWDEMEVIKNLEEYLSNEVKIPSEQAKNFISKIFFKTIDVHETYGNIINNIILKEVESYKDKLNDYEKDRLKQVRRINIAIKLLIKVSKEDNKMLRLLKPQLEALLKTI